MNIHFIRMFRALIVIITIYNLGTSYAQRTCETDIECMTSDETCRYGFCECVPGLALQTGVCQSVLGWTCTTPGMTSADCLAEGTWCDHGSTCQCDPAGWVAIGDRCSLEFGMICPHIPGDPYSADCTGIGMMCNHDTNLCDCDTINGWHYNGITCFQESLSAQTCTNDADCHAQDPNGVCKNMLCACADGTWEIMPGTCENRASMGSNTCAVDADCVALDHYVECKSSFCACADGTWEVMPGTCENPIGKHCSTPDMTIPPECPIDGMRCDAATFTCQCDEGQGWSLFDSRCILQGSSMGTNTCADDSDCQALDPYGECKSSFCACADGTWEVMPGTCENPIGKHCSAPDISIPPECPVEGMRCDAATSTCQCDEGKGWTLFDNRCIIHGSSMGSNTCAIDADCQALDPYGKCKSSLCTCADGTWEVIPGTCENPVGIHCSVPDTTFPPECPFEGLRCDAATSACQCDEGQGWTLYEDRCIHECTVGVSSLHDMSRRLKSYLGSSGEPVVTDHKLTEGWYSMGQYHLLDSATDLMPGTCGTFHQIILKDGISVDWDNLDTNEVTLPATVVGLPAGLSEDLEIHVRKCLGDIQYYLRRPKSRFASYCFESLEDVPSEPGSEDPLVISNSYYFYIQSSLNFKREQRDGIWIDNPYILWNIHLGTNIDDILTVPEAEFIRITWFANNVLIRSSTDRLIDVIFDIENGVWPGAQITDMELLEAGFSMGAVLRCGVQFSRTETGRMSAMSITFLRLDMPLGRTFMSLNNDKNILLHQTNIPLGCARPEDTVEETCNLKLDVIHADGGSICSDTNFGNEHSHELCGLTVVGLTRHGLEMRGYNYNSWDLSYSSSYENGTELRKSIGTHIMLDSSSEELVPGASIYVTATTSENTAGHRFWDSYTARNIQITASDGEFQWPGYHSCATGLRYMEAYEKTELAINRYGYYNDYSSESLDKTIALVESGKYIMLWSGQYPFSFEIEIETKDGSSYLCGATIRYGNDVYIYSMCGGVFIEGLVFGNGKYLPEIITGQLYITELGLEMYISVVASQLEISFYRDSTDFSNGLEGLCTFGADGMLGRDGNIYHLEADFINTWRIEYDESQTNPSNQIQYKTESSYYTCGCPAKTDNVPNRVVVYENDWFSDHNVYTGVVHCNLDEHCTDVTEGEVWKKTLLPDYLIDKVTIEPEVLIDPYGEPILLFICQFHVVQQYYYKVQWFIDDILFREVGPVLPDDEDLFTITDDDIYYSNTNFHLDMKMQCLVSVSSATEEVLISPLTSESFYPIEVVSTYASLRRGGDTTVSFKIFIPFKCTGGAPNCDLEIKLSDPFEDCKRSSVAIKSEDHCGGRIRLNSGDVAAMGKEITTVLTTKNNDKNDLKTVFILDIVVLFHSSGKSYWTRPLEHKITVEVTDKTIDWIGQDCHMHVDPHMCNMDGVYFENQNEGQFTLLKSKTLPVEIQAITKKCFEGWGGWSPTCACGIIIKAGGDIYVNEHCTTDHHFTGFISALDKVVNVYQQSETRYQVILPSQMMIDFNIMPFFDYVMNIDILPSVMEKSNSEGLCGNFNGIFDDDFIVRGTTDAGDNDEFSMSWELMTNNRWDENLLNPINYLNPTRWKTEEKLCTCRNAATDFDVEPVCSVNEEDTCTREKPRKGRKQNVETRHKRDASFINLDIERRLDRLRNFIFEQHAHATPRKKRSSGVQSNVTEEKARELCEEAFNNNCPANRISNKPVDESTYLADCIKDVVASNGDTSWAGPQCDCLTTRIETAIEQDVLYANNNTDVVTEVEQLCVGNCNNHGVCNNGTCQCDVGWSSENCLIDEAKTVEITSITGDGECDLGNPEYGDCENLVVEANGFTREVYSKVDVYQAGRDGTFVKSHELNRPAEYLSFNEVIVDVTGARRRRSTSADPVVAHQYGVSVSNDGTNFGSIVYVTVLDTRCQEKGNDTDGNTIVFLKAGFCYIDGTCYSEGISSASSSCYLCRTAVDLFDWTEENCPTTTTTTTTAGSSDNNDIPIYALVLGVVGGVLVIGAIVGLVIFKCMSQRRPVSPLPEAPPPYYSPRPDGPMNLRYYINQIMVAEADAEKGKAPI